MTWVVLGFVIVVALAMYRISKAPVLQQSRIRLDQVREIYDSLKGTGSDGSFVVFIPTPPQGQVEAANIQFSIENGRIGLDWVLISPVNIRDRDRFTSLLDANDAQYRELASGDVALPFVAVEVLDLMVDLAGVEVEGDFKFSRS